MQHHYFGSGHGKGEHDGVGVVVKCTLIAKQLKLDGAKLQNAEDAVNYLATTLPSTHKARRRFVLVKGKDVNRKTKWDCNPVKGT